MGLFLQEKRNFTSYKKDGMSNIYEIPCAPQNFPITAVSFVSAAKLLVPSKMVKTSCAHSVPFLPCSKKNDDISILIKMLVFCAQGHLMYYVPLVVLKRCGI